MKFHEKLLSLRKKQGLSQEKLGAKLRVSRQTISKWEVGQSYPDFQRLVLLSDYFGMTLDELVKDIDVQEVREKNVTDELIVSLFNDTEKVKNSFYKFLKILCFVGLVVIAIVIITFIAHLLLPNTEWLWRIKNNANQKKRQLFSSWRIVLKSLIAE